MARLVPIHEYLWFQEGPGVRNTQYTSSGVKLLNVANFVDGEIDLSTSQRYISEEEAYGKYSHFLVDDGDFIIASSGIQVDYFEKKMGFVSAAQLPLCMNTSTIRFKNLRHEELNLRFFMYYLKSEHFKRQLKKYIVGSAQLNFGPSHLNKMSFPLIDYPEQVRIVKALDKLYSLISLRKQQIAKLDELVKARFVEMFGGIDPALYMSMAELCSIITDGTHQPPKFVETGIPFLFVSNITGNVLTYDAEKFIDEQTYSELIKRTPIEIGDILLSTVGSYGHPAIVKEATRFCFQRHIAYLKPRHDIIDCNYLHGAILSSVVQEQIEAKVKGIAQKTLNLSEIRTIRLPVPCMDEQHQFAAFVAQTDQQKSTIQHSLAQLELLKKALMQKYFG